MIRVRRFWFNAATASENDRALAGNGGSLPTRVHSRSLRCLEFLCSAISMKELKPQKTQKSQNAFACFVIAFLLIQLQADAILLILKKSCQSCFKVFCFDLESARRNELLPKFRERIAPNYKSATSAFNFFLTIQTFNRVGMMRLASACLANSRGMCP